MRLIRFPFGAQFLCLLPLLLSACGGEKAAPAPASSPEDGYFESAASAQSGSGVANGGPASGGVDLNIPGAAAPTEGAAGNAAQRAIAEADIIQLAGSTLYAMSRSGGLSVIDVSRPAALEILGRYRTSFTPFEMYIKDGVVFAMYSDWGYFVVDEATQARSWKQTSSLLALDVTDPKHIEKLAQFDVPGEISDSRLVGNVLYAVSYQNGSCWQCAQQPATNVVSIDVAKPSKPVKVDELSFASDDRYGWGKRSISVTTQRIYVAGPEYGLEQPENSKIQVVDISDPKGDLVAGATVSIKGQITNRWQMDETDGVLRVISQPWTWWNNSVAPALETYRVDSSQQLERLAHLEIALPRPESLQAVRFDGPRGYAVTFERKDPLFTFDLSDPENPRQMGALEMPGFLYHMEPRGNRLIGLGFDQGNPAGAITVSIFDVTDLARPSLIQRVNFGGDWAYFAEDQDRIHKLFKLDPDNGLMLVPFSGWKATEKGYCGSALNGVQLIDWAGDSLALRGMAPSLGQARRAFMLKDTLFTVAEQEVAAFDLANRDDPKQISQAPLSLNVSLTLPAADKLVRLRHDWYSADMRLEVVPRATPEALVAPVTFNLTEYLREKHGLKNCGYWYPSNEPLFAVGDTVWALINDYGNWNYDGTDDQKGRSLLVGFSPQSGAVSGSLVLPFQPGYWGYSNTSRVVKGSTALLLQEGWNQTGNTRSLAAIDLSDPATPRLAYTLPLPTNDYYGSVGMLDSGDELVTSYAQRVPGKNDLVRHFALRLDISDPLRPKLLGAYNVPGYVVDFDAAHDALVTLDHQATATKLAADACYALGNGHWYDGTTGICHGYASSLNRVVLGSGIAHITDTLRSDELAWSTPRRAEGRLFFPSFYSNYYSEGAGGGYYGGWNWSSLDVTVVNSETLASSKIQAPGVWNSLPNGTSLILAPSAGQPLTVIDGRDVTQLELRQTKEIALGYTEHLSVVDGTVYLSQGDGGVQTMSLP